MTVASSGLSPFSPGEGPHLHHARVHYHLLYTERKLFTLFPQLSMNRMKPPAETRALPCEVARGLRVSPFSMGLGTVAGSGDMEG